ncbi:PAS-domain containing protein [Yoonia sediminilitoris]|nr:PAS-domain containing protein [Yoonia sediminilitoris]
MNLLDFLMVVLAAVLGSGVLIYGLQYLERSDLRKPQRIRRQDGCPVFLFQDRQLIDATPEALAMITPHLDRHSHFEATLHVLGPHFPKLRETLARDKIEYQRINDGGAENLWVDIQKSDGLLRLSLAAQSEDGTSGVTDVIERDIRMSELQLLRDFTQNTPQLFWQDDETGKLIWANHAYLTFCDKLLPDRQDENQIWPSEPLLPDLHESAISKTPSIRRLSVTLPDRKAEQWFDVTSMRRNDGFIHFASDANAIVRADQERRNFVQTLTKTFAQLSIGIAIFDKRRQLAMFNPALLDMTGLPIGLLSARPTVDAVLDRLRESRMLPEPKDYSSWRDQFTALEQAAKDGSYSENWNLPDGQTYRVTGRPHPDGAIAFLFEDISAEISLTRSFRSDIETGQSVLDSLADAIAVFSSPGTLMMSNKAYANLWGPVSEESVQQHEIQHAMAIWQDRCTPTKMWADLRQFIQILGPRTPWSDTAILDDGRQITCDARPIAGGMTMVKFTVGLQANPILKKLTEADPAIRVAKR